MKYSIRGMLGVVHGSLCFARGSLLACAVSRRLQECHALYLYIYIYIFKFYMHHIYLSIYHIFVCIVIAGKFILIYIYIHEYTTLDLLRSSNWEKVLREGQQCVRERKCWGVACVHMRCWGLLWFWGFSWVWRFSAFLWLCLLLRSLIVLRLLRSLKFLWLPMALSSLEAS